MLTTVTHETQAYKRQTASLEWVCGQLVAGQLAGWLAWFLHCRFTCPSCVPATGGPEWHAPSVRARPVTVADRWFNETLAWSRDMGVRHGHRSQRRTNINTVIGRRRVADGRHGPVRLLPVVCHCLADTAALPTLLHQHCIATLVDEKRRQMLRYATCEPLNTAKVQNSSFSIIR